MGDDSRHRWQPVSTEPLIFIVLEVVVTWMKLIASSLLLSLIL